MLCPHSGRSRRTQYRPKQRPIRPRPTGAITVYGSRPLDWVGCPFWHIHRLFLKFNIIALTRGSRDSCVRLEPHFPNWPSTGLPSTSAFVQIPRRTVPSDQVRRQTSLSLRTAGHPKQQHPLERRAPPQPRQFDAALRASEPFLTCVAQI